MPQIVEVQPLVYLSHLPHDTTPIVLYNSAHSALACRLLWSWQGDALAFHRRARSQCALLVTTSKPTLRHRCYYRYLLLQISKKPRVLIKKSNYKYYKFVYMIMSFSLIGRLKLFASALLFLALFVEIYPRFKQGLAPAAVRDR